MNEYYLIHQNRYKYILKQIDKLGLSAGAKILDVGCYPLDMFNALQEKGFNMFGISSQHEKVKDKKNIVALNIESDELPFDDNFFDLILFSEVMEHMVYAPNVYLEKFMKVLKPSGLLLITTPNAVHIKHRLELLRGKSQNFPLFQFDDSIYHRHNREFTLDEVKEVVTQVGFEVIQAKHFGAYSPFRKKLQREPAYVKIGKGLVYLPTMFFPALRDSIFLLAQKC